MATIHELEERYSLQLILRDTRHAVGITQGTANSVTAHTSFFSKDCSPLLALFRFLLFYSNCMEILIISLNGE